MIIWQRLHDGCRKGKEVSLRAGVECGEEGKTSSTTNSSLVFDQHNSDFGLHWKIAKGSWKNASWKKKKEKCMRFPTSTIFQSLSLLKVL